MQLVELPNGVSLEVDLTPPSGSSRNSEEQTAPKLAVCLHPWSWLGGRKDDPVLLSLIVPLHSKDYHVLRYNSRGVGASTGWPSFTGLREVQDLQELVKWALRRIPGVASVIFIGYSHGSLIASLHPTIPTIQTSHILISYPLGPRGWLTLFHTATYARRLKELVGDESARVLMLYGDRDEFTGVDRYREWREGVEREGKGRVRMVEVAGGSHFWRGERLQEEVVRWLP